jgi:hypothetical protein
MSNFSLTHLRVHTRTHTHSLSCTHVCYLLVQMHFQWREKTDPVKNFGDFVYLSQATQALCLKSETEFYRRNRNQKPNTMGAIYW